MRPAHLTFGITAEHACKLRDARTAVEDGDVCRRDAALCVLAHQNMVMRPGGDLRQMRDGEDLMIVRDTAHRLAHWKRHASANARVDFVEDERRDAIEPRENRLESEHDTRQFSAARHACQRTLVVAGIQRYAKLDRLRALSADVPRRENGRMKVAIGHTELGKHLVPGSASAPGP